MIRMLVVDDHQFFRAQIIGLLRAADGIDVVGECSDGSEVPDAVEAVRPDVVLMDMRMPVTSGVIATRDLVISHPSIRVVMMSGANGTGAIQESATAGARGFVVKGGPPKLLIDAVRTVAAGGTAWPDQGIGGNEGAVDCRARPSDERIGVRRALRTAW